MRKSTTPECDWLYGQSGGILKFCRPKPPEPISGPIEVHHKSDEPLSAYRDESRWSDEIEAWSKDHVLELNYVSLADEE